MVYTADPRYTIHQTHDFWATMFVITTCSIVASLLIALSYLLLPKSRTAFNRIIICLSIADLGTSICGPVCGQFLLNTDMAKAASGTLCMLQGSTLVYFALCSICWLGVIAFSNYLLVVHNKSPSARMEIAFHAICWGLPMVPTIVALATNAFGYYDMLWCSYSESHVLEAIICLSVFIIPVLLIITYCYGAIIWKIRTTKDTMIKLKSFHSSTMAHGDLRAIIRMSGFIIIYIVTWFPYFASYVNSFMNPKSEHFHFGIIVSALAHSQGISNFFLYCLNRQFFDMARSAFFAWFPSLRQMDSKLSVPSTASSPTTTPRSSPSSSFISKVMAPFALRTSSAYSYPEITPIEHPSFLSKITAPFGINSLSDESPAITRPSSDSISIPAEHPSLMSKILTRFTKNSSSTDSSSNSSPAITRESSLESSFITVPLEEDS